MPRTVTITGARATGEADLPALFRAYLQPFADEDVRVYLGGAVGIDATALDWLATHTRCRLTVVVPCTVADQPAEAAGPIHHWREHERLDDLVELRAPTVGTEAYHARNRWMVDRSEFVIGFPHGTDPRSGTWYTLNYAAEHAKPRLIVPLL